MMTEDELLRFGNELEIVGMMVGNRAESLAIWFPNSTIAPGKFIQPTKEDMEKILNQLDTLGVKDLSKVVLRKSQRQIEQDVSWSVFRRDNYTCRYCGANDVPLTVDHIVLWEHGGASTEKNLISACRKCNKTRGSMLYGDWLKSPYYENAMLGFGYQKEKAHIANEDAELEALMVPLRKTQRSR